jgi:hypothetical protein
MDLSGLPVTGVMASLLTQISRVANKFEFEDFSPGPILAH